MPLSFSASYKSIPGPGDEITWGAPTGHPNDPRTESIYDDGSLMTQGEAEDDAADGVAHDMNLVSDWLAKACDGQLDVSSKTELDDVHGLPIPRLLSVLLNGSDKAALAARRELKWRLIEEHMDVVRENASDAWHGQFAGEAPYAWGQE